MHQSNLNIIRVDQPAVYRIEVQGELDAEWADSFGDLRVEHVRSPGGGTVTVLSGAFADQAALAGVLALAYMLRMPLRSVTLLSEDQGSTSPTP